MTSPLRPVEEQPSPPDEPREARSARRRFLPALVVAAALGVVALLYATRHEVVVQAPEFLPPLVRVMEVTPQTLRLDVQAEGSVEAAVESELASEVAGRVLALGPDLVEGGTFAEGDVLLRLDDRDYRVALEKARAVVERRESETRLAESQLQRWARLEGGGVISIDQLEEGENQAAVARAELRSARAELAQAELDLERTVIRAPYDGRVLDTAVDRGQFLARASPIATVYSTARAEVRLPVSDDALADLGIPLDYHAAEGDAAPEVRFRAEVAGRDAEWLGVLDRVEGQVDPRTRMVTLVARVEDPFGRERADAPPPLAPGLFVRAEIAGRSVENAVRIPAGALREGRQVLVLEDDVLRFREVTVLRRERDTILIGGGLAAGEVVCVSSLEAATDGMKVRRAPES